MKQFLLLFLVISVTAAYRVINVNSASEPGLYKSEVESRGPFGFRSPSEGLSDPEVSKIDDANVDDGLKPENSRPSSTSATSSRVSSMYGWIHDVMRMMMEKTMSPFRNHFPDVFQIKSKPEEGPVVELGLPSEVLPGLLDSVLTDSEVANHMKIPSAHKLPPNYSNSTSEVHDSKDAQLIVNQTIDKKSGDGFSKFFVVKSFLIRPKNLTLNQDAEHEVAISAEAHKDQPRPDSRLNEVEFKGKVDPLEREQESGQTIAEGDPQSKYRVRRVRREIRDQILKSASDTGLKKIEFPPGHLNRFPESFLNNRNIRVEDLKNSLGGPSKSMSYVYKKIGGKTTIYVVDHKPKTKEELVEAVRPDFEGIPPPDLSRDTKVNPSGNDDQQQSLVLVHPDAEVFDLNLVAKEIESRPKDK